jgi:hypothetical protein
MKLIGELPPELGLCLGTKSPVRLGRLDFGFSFGFGFDFGYGYGYGFGFGSGYRSGYGYGYGYGKGSKDIQYEDHR